MANVLVFGAGGPAGINFTRAALAAGHNTVAVDDNPLHLDFCLGEVVHLMPSLTDPTFRDYLVELCHLYSVDVIHSQPEQIVVWLGDHRGSLYGNVLLPDSRTIQLTQNKLETCLAWARKGLVGYNQLLEIPEQFDEAEQHLAYPMWVRAIRGAGARGATLATTREMAESWVRYWWERDPSLQFVASEYLPGRDYAWTSIWREGALVACQGRERIEYIYPHLAPSGRTGTPTIAVTTADLAVTSAGIDAVLAIDEIPHGVFCVDMRESAEGKIVPTEINAGRFFTTSDFYAAAGCNFVDIYIRAAAFDIWPDEPMIGPIKAGMWWMRHIDSPSKLIDDAARPELREIRLRDGVKV